MNEAAQRYVGHDARGDARAGACGIPPSSCPTTCRSTTPTWRGSPRRTRRAASSGAASCPAARRTGSTGPTPASSTPRATSSRSSASGATSPTASWPRRRARRPSGCASRRWRRRSTATSPSTTDGRIVEFNAAAERTFGYARAEAIGRPMTELMVPPHARELATERSLAGELDAWASDMLDRRVEVDAMRADGTVFPIELVVVKGERGGGDDLPRLPARPLRAAGGRARARRARGAVPHHRRERAGRPRHQRPRDRAAALHQPAVAAEPRGRAGRDAGVAAARLGEARAARGAGARGRPSAARPRAVEVGPADAERPADDRR